MTSKKGFSNETYRLTNHWKGVSNALYHQENNETDIYQNDFPVSHINSDWLKFDNRKGFQSVTKIMIGSNWHLNKRISNDTFIHTTTINFKELPRIFKFMSVLRFLKNRLKSFDSFLTDFSIKSMHPLSTRPIKHHKYSYTRIIHVVSILHLWAWIRLLQMVTKSLLNFIGDLSTMSITKWNQKISSSLSPNLSVMNWKWKKSI